MSRTCSQCSLGYSFLNSSAGIDSVLHQRRSATWLRASSGHNLERKHVRCCGRFWLRTVGYLGLSYIGKPPLVADPGVSSLMAHTLTQVRRVLWGVLTLEEG